jgi:hypothetical protein
MPTQGVPRDQWARFLESFSQLHEGWLGTLQIFDSQGGSRIEARNLPLESRSYGLRSRRRTDHLH